VYGNEIRQLSGTRAWSRRSVPEPTISRRRRVNTFGYRHVTAAQNPLSVSEKKKTNRPKIATSRRLSVKTVGRIRSDERREIADDSSPWALNPSADEKRDHYTLSHSPRNSDARACVARPRRIVERDIVSVDNS